MTGSEMKLVSFMQGSNKRFVIPVYQRNYDWKTENCKQLYDDLIVHDSYRIVIECEESMRKIFGVEQSEA